MRTDSKRCEGASPRPPSRLPSPLPFVGREAELRAIVDGLEQARAGRGRTTFVAGPGGVGKTRLVTAASGWAAQRGWTVATGRAYPVETGFPYAVWSDAMGTVLPTITTSALTVLTRGDGGTLSSISPAFAAGAGSPARHESGGEARSRLLWGFTQFLARLAATRPLLVVLENLQWADASSLELLHFVARNVSEHPVALLCTYNDAESDASPTLRATEQSLLSVGAASSLRVGALGTEALEALVRELFGADAPSARTLAGKLGAWTRGNAFFVEEILKALVDSGALAEREGAWHGWDAELPGLPRSIRDAVAVRINRLGTAARAVANVAAVAGSRTAYAALAAASGLPETDVLCAIDELRALEVLTEEGDAREVRYEFTHPLLREVLYAELGLARALLLHATVASALEELYGADAIAHADELAYHFARAGPRAGAGKALRYLEVAGRDALARHANREAADYLTAALAQRERADPAHAERGGEWRAVAALIEDLAQARQRLGEYDAATALWLRARESAERAGDVARLAAIERRLGLACYWSGRYDAALAHFEVARERAAAAGDASLEARVRVAQASTLQALGQPDAARDVVDDTIARARRLGDPAVLARAHRSSLLLRIFIGPSDRARADGEHTIAFAAAARDKRVEWSAHWAMATLCGLTGSGGAMAHHLAAGERLADELGSPVLRCWSAEVAIEYASGTGDWDGGLALAARTLPTARALGQRLLVPRLLVWSALIHLHRGAVARAREQLDEAWQLSGGDAPQRLADVHSAIPTHAGLVALHVATGDHHRALQVGDAGLALVDRTGYVSWGVHRLLPVMIEAALWRNDLATAERYRDRLRRDSEQLGHQLGFAWADTCDALIAMLRRDLGGAEALLRRGAEALEAVPWVFDAARLRRKLAWVLATTGDRDGAARELRAAHATFLRLGAEPELALTREVLREVGVRPPARSRAAGMAGLTGREVDVTRLAATHKSNKEIAASLGMSPRTVSTHLSNIFGKLDVGSRGELAEVARREGLLQ